MTLTEATQFTILVRYGVHGAATSCMLVWKNVTMNAEKVWHGIEESRKLRCGALDIHLVDLQNFKDRFLRTKVV